MSKKKTEAKSARPRDASALLLRGAIAILILAALAVALNLLQQTLFPQGGAVSTPSSMILPASRESLAFILIYPVLSIFSTENFLA